MRRKLGVVMLAIPALAFVWFMAFALAWWGPDTTKSAIISATICCILVACGAIGSWLYLHEPPK